uniref:Uncharacterized protein n=1 Tax=Arundo donax TaxID=35708 RepID=A0A0A9HPB2_ARUDO
MVNSSRQEIQGIQNSKGNSQLLLPHVNIQIMY